MEEEDYGFFQTVPDYFRSFATFARPQPANNPSPKSAKATQNKLIQNAIAASSSSFEDNKYFSIALQTSILPYLTSLQAVSRTFPKKFYINQNATEAIKP